MFLSWMPSNQTKGLGQKHDLFFCHFFPVKTISPLVYTLSFILTKQLVHFLTFKTEHLSFPVKQNRKKNWKKNQKTKNKITIENVNSK